MSLQDLSTVANILPRLDGSELLKVRDKASALLALTTTNPSPAAPLNGAHTDYLFEGVVAELRRRGLLGRDKRPNNKSVPVSYATDAHRIRSLLNEHVGGRGFSAAEYAFLGQLAIRCLASYLETHKSDEPISCNLLCRKISKVPQALDESYPGYLEAGILPFALRSK